MQLLVYLFAYPLIWLISILPFRILYLLSDAIYILVYRIIGYRKSTVRQNLALAFPEYSAQKRLEIEKKFYKHLCDMFLEMTKTMTISEAEMARRFKFTNIEVYSELEKQPKNIALMCAHYASYEWAVSMNNHIKFTGYAIYKQLGNRYFDQLVRKIRLRFKGELITTKETIQVIEKNQKNGVRGVYGFASDQSPRASSAFHWTKFMGIQTPIHTGAEMLAKRFDLNVIFMGTTKVKRGYYEARFEVLSLDAKSVPDYEISEKFFRRVEQQIREAPEFYLWTHKRWKHSEKD